MQALADEAAAAPATIYQPFGTKQAILAPAFDVIVAGNDAPLAVLNGAGEHKQTANRMCTVSPRFEVRSGTAVFDQNDAFTVGGRLLSAGVVLLATTVCPDPSTLPAPMNVDLLASHRLMGLPHDG